MSAAARNIYQEEKSRFLQELMQLKKKQNLYGWLRLGIVLVAGVCAFYFFSVLLVAGWITIALGIAAFLFLVSADASNNQHINRLKLLIQINEQELDVLDENYSTLFDGAAFTPHIHGYANDLDIFGKASLYQYINRCSSEQGRQLLADNLLQPLSLSAITNRQEAIKELAPQYQWRQALQQLALENPVTIATQKKSNSLAGRRERKIYAPRLAMDCTCLYGVYYFDGYRKCFRLPACQHFLFLVFVVFHFCRKL